MFEIRPDSLFILSVEDVYLTLLREKKLQKTQFVLSAVFWLLYREKKIYSEMGEKIIRKA